MISQYFDPVLENDLPDGMELMIKTIGPRAFLLEAIEQLGVSVSKPIDELTDEECMKVCRGIYRNAKDYSGPEMQQ